MRFSPSLVTSTAVACVSTVLLCSPAASQLPTGPAATLPPVTVDAPKQAARPQRPVQSTNTTGSRRTHSTMTARTPSYAPGSVMGRIAKLEASASSCNGGCESSFPRGKDPWVGCSGTGGIAANDPFSPTCRDTLTYKNYLDCVETKTFLGEVRSRAWWFCSSLAAGNKFQVADIKRSGRR